MSAGIKSETGTKSERELQLFCASANALLEINEQLDVLIALTRDLTRLAHLQTGLLRSLLQEGSAP
jgi:hypothetical protein